MARASTRTGMAWLVAAALSSSCAGGQGSSDGRDEGAHATVDSTESETGSGDDDDVSTTGAPDVDVPGSPTDLQVTADALSLDLSWSPPLSGGPAHAYEVLLDGSEAAEVAAPTTSISLTDLEAARRYLVQVRAVNAAGSSAPSAAVEILTDFSPDGFPNTQLWFDADDASTFTLVEDRVASWRDKSGNDNHAFQAINDLRPVLAGGPSGRAAVHFDDAFLTTTDTLQLREQGDGYTLIAVAMNTTPDGVTGNAGRGGILLGNYGTDTPNVAFELHEDRVLRQWWDTRDQSGLPAAEHTGDMKFPAPRPAQGAYAILYFYLDADRRKVGAGVDGALATEIDDEGPTFSVTMPFRIGGDYRASPLPVSWNGDIAELLLFDRVMSEDERDRLHDYLSTKWDIPVN
jgi:hypothetical protein